LPTLEIAGLTVFILLLFVGIFTTIFGLPGTVIILIDVIIYALVTGLETIGLKVIFILLVISAIAEGLDFALVAAGVARFGSSKRRLWATFLGSAMGVMILTPLLLGFGTILGLFLGGFLAVLVEELIWQNKLKPSLRTGSYAILGRAFGTLLKGGLSFVMIIITLSQVYS
jgi:hypothetical protein